MGTETFILLQDPQFTSIITDEKIRKDLEKAKGYFYSWRLVESYNILRRYFDRLPFKPEKYHAVYIGMFIRTLVELGKDYELKFYMTELESLYEKNKTADIGFQLGMVYCHSIEPDFRRAKELFESVIKTTDNREIRIKAKLGLAVCYDIVSDDFAYCKKIIDSVEETNDPVLRLTVEIWKAKVARDLGNYDESISILFKVYEGIKLQSNWYVYFSTKVVEAGLFIKMKKFDKAQIIIRELNKMFIGKHFRTVKRHLDGLAKIIQKQNQVLKILYEKNERILKLSSGSKSIEIKSGTVIERLLLLLLEVKKINKNEIINIAYSRAYEPQKDDKFVYYQIHAIRKLLEKLDLGKGVLVNHEEVYSIIIESERGSQC